MPTVVFVEHNGLEHAVDVSIGDTLMEGAVRNAVPGIVAACGGDGGCATCQVYVEEGWTDLIGKPSANERNTLQFAFERRANSRLACQIVMTEALHGLVLRMPPRQF